MADVMTDGKGNGKGFGKRIGCFSLIVLTTVSLLFHNAAAMKVEKENKHRKFLFSTVVEAVQDYYKAHQQYPKALVDLNHPQSELISEFLQAGVFEYKRDQVGTKWFTLTCRYSGILASGKTHRLSWKGIQYSNIKEQLPLSPDSALGPDEDGFYFADFH